MWDPTPWFVGGGAQHSPEIARLLAYAATSGSEGIVGAADLQVRALAVPGGYVRAAPGACVIRNRSTGGTLQTYIGRLPTEDVVAIAPTGSAGGRNDLIIARVEDPFMAGTPWQDPADPAAGPYIFTRVIPNVPTSALASPNAARAYVATLGYSAIPLAGVVLPASTATVTSAMIKPLREMSNPRRKRDVSTYAVTAGGTETNTISTADGEIWPNAATNLWGGIEVPDWATQARVVCTWSGVNVPPGNSFGLLWVQLGSDGDTNKKITQSVRYDTTNSTNRSRETLIVGDTISIPQALRGTVQPFRPKARWDGGSTSARIQLDAGSAVILDFEFLEAPSEDNI